MLIDLVEYRSAGEIRPSSYLALLTMVNLNPFSWNKSPPQCRICFIPEQKSCFDRTSSPLVTPCKCRGSLAYVHLDCIYHWKKISMRSKCEICQETFVFRGKYYKQKLRVLLHILWMNLCSDDMGESEDQDGRAWEEGLSMYYHDLMDPVFDTFIKPFVPSEDSIITVLILVLVFSCAIWFMILCSLIMLFKLIMRRKRNDEINL